MGEPKVSVIIPTYNYAQYLPEAIESVLSQDFTDFELIIADDASRDESAEVCKKYADRDSRIRAYVHEENKGMVENWNWCVKQARGDYIKLMLADDKFSKPYALGRMVDELDKNDEVSLVVSSRLLIDEKSRVFAVAGPLGCVDRHVRGKKIIQRCLERDGNDVGEPTAAMFKRKDGQRLFDKSFNQLVDLEMWFHLLTQGDLAYISEPLCCFRVHSLQQTNLNIIQGNHGMESLQLLYKYASSNWKQCAFERIYSWKKKNDKKLNESIASLMKEFSSLELAKYNVRHKVVKPVHNIVSAYVKRMQYSQYIKSE